MCTSMEKRGEYIGWILKWPDTSSVKKINAHMSGLSSFLCQKSLFLKNSNWKIRKFEKRITYLACPAAHVRKRFQKFNQHIWKLKSSVVSRDPRFVVKFVWTNFVLCKVINYILILKSFISFSLSKTLS